MHNLNLALRFLLEIVALAALAFGGWTLAPEGLAQWILAGALPLAFAAVWGAYIAPRAPARWTDPARLILEIFLFSGAAVALGWAGYPGLSVLFGVLVAGNLSAMFYFSQREY